MDDTLRTTVSDTGSGIPDSLRGNLFEPFVSYGKENGTGLGLTIVQKIAQDHGGSVTVQNAVKGNTVFRLTIRQALDADAGWGQKNEAQRNSPERNKVTASPARRASG